MTKLEKRKTRALYETAATVQGRTITIELRPSYMLIRTKRARRPMIIGYDACYWAAAKLEDIERRREKRPKQTR